MPVSVSTSNGALNGTSNGTSNGSSDSLTNGYSSGQVINATSTQNGSSNSSVQTKKYHANTLTSDQQVTILRQTVRATRSRLISETSHVNDHYIDSMTVESFLEYIEDERLTHMPRQGSHWDNVLKWAEFFALQVSRYEIAVHSFVSDSKNAAKMIWAASRVIIEVSRIFVFPVEFPYASRTER
jgi:hypothetical protein